MLIKYQIRNNFQSLTGQTYTVSGGTDGGLYKSLTIPISMEFFPVDYGDDLQDIVIEERKKAINPTFDAETTRYKYANDLANLGKGMMIQFRFWDASASTFSTSYIPAGFDNLDISKRRNGFKKSFFRLNFFNSNSADTSSLLFTEDIDVDDTTQPMMPFNRLYWLRNDEYFVKNNNNRIVYMNASFFNAKTGKIQRFINTPTSITSPLTITQYSDITNREWRTSAVELINPKLNNGEFNFRPYVPFGANTLTTITLSEFIMI